ncbi:MAG: hypothetical protein JO057_25925, partial [Chloroflexi bacterium]|nr:hypothetical protein [Chloroflexota bacterium]
LGTTAPLWALILGAGYHLGLTDLPWLATVMSAVCDAASVCLLVWLGLRLGWRPLGAGLVGLAWAFNPMSIAFATGGMETSLFVLLALGVLSLVGPCRRPVLAASLAALATLVRPEGALLVLTVGAWTLLFSRTRLWRTVLAAGVPLVAAGAVMLARYGSPLPNSVAAKEVAYQPTWPLENGVALLVQAGLPGWSTYLLGVVPAAVGLLLALIGVVSLGALLRLAAFGVYPRRSAAWLAFAAFGALYVTFYVSVGLRGVRLFPWYLVPIEPLYLLGAAAGLARLGGARRAWLAAVLVVWQLPAIDWHQPLLPAGQDLAREQLYLSVGHQLASSLPGNAEIAAPEIGALGYASNLRVLDTVGLVSPSALPYYPLPADELVTDNAIPARLIDDQRPDAVVTLDVFADRSLLDDPTFQGEYQLVASYPSHVWQSQSLLVFRKTQASV